MNRRQLLLRGSLLAALAPVVRAAVTPAAATHAVLFAVHDPAYRRSREFALALQDRGARLVAADPDVLALWHAVLQPACHLQPAGLRMAGLTTRTDFLVLRDCARGAGFVPLATQDADAGALRRRATLISWVLGQRSAAA
jgi:hypothetical protein